jgi:hypothetical protein
MFNFFSDPMKHDLQSFPVNSSSYVNPNATNPLYMGEWLEFNTSNKLTRAAGDKPSFCNYTPRGEVSAQGLEKITIIMRPGWIAETQIMVDTGLTTPGQPLRVDDVTIDSQTKSGLKLWTAGTDYIVGRVLEIPTSSYAWLRFQAADPSRFA